jgi:nucleotide-sensitive chloride channel 1A
VIWLCEAEKGKGYAVDFLDITLHAVSRDLEAYPSPCIYTQVIGAASAPFANTFSL